MKIFKNYLYTLSYQIFLLLVPFITLPYITRTLGANNYGVNSFLFSITNYFVLISVFGISTYGQRQIAYVKDNLNTLKKNFWEIEILSILMTIVSVVFFLVFILVYGKFQTEFLIYGITIVSSALDVSWFFIGMERFKILSVRNFFIKILSVIFIFMFVKTKNDLNIYISIISISTLLSALMLLVPTIKIVGFPKQSSQLHPFIHLKESAVLFIPQIATVLYVVLNKSIIGFLNMFSEAAYFDSADKIIRMTFSALIALSTVLLPSLASKFRSNDNSSIKNIVQNSIKFSLMFVIPLVVMINIQSEKIVDILFGDGFMQVKSVLQVEACILIPMSVANVAGNQILFPMRMNKKFNMGIIAGMLVNLLISVPLIYEYKAVGAAIAVLIAESVVAVVQFKFQNILTISDILTEIWKIILATGGMSLILTIGLKFDDSILVTVIVTLISMIVYIVILFVLKYAALVNVYKKVKGKGNVNT